MSRSDARKPESDRLPYLSVVYLNQQGVIEDGIRSVLTTERGGYISDKVQIDMTIGYEPLMLITFDINNEVKRQKIPLTKTGCNFGGFRWWFKCPLCNKRVGKLFLYGSVYGCRHCYDLTYKSRMLSSRSPPSRLKMSYLRSQKARELIEGLRSTTYKGKPTKRYKKILELTEYEDGY